MYKMDIVPAYRISKAVASQAPEIFGVYDRCRAALEQEHIYQWYEGYPAFDIIEDDITRGELYCLMKANTCIAAIGITLIQEGAYNSITWLNDTGKALIVHRLAVDPCHQGKGYASMLMNFAEDYAAREAFDSIRLDTYSENPRALRLYEARSYLRTGTVYFTGRKAPFYCYEKLLKPNHIDPILSDAGKAPGPLH